MSKITLTMPDSSQKYLKNFVLILTRNYDHTKQENNVESNKLTRQNVEDMEQILKIESAELYEHQTKKRKKFVCHNKRSASQSFVSQVSNIFKTASSTQQTTITEHKIPIKHIIHIPNLPTDTLEQIADQLHKHENAKSHVRRMGRTSDLVVLPEITNAYGVTQKVQLCGRRNKPIIHENSFVESGSKKLSSRVRTKMEEFESVLNDVDRELALENYKESRRREMIHRRERSHQLKQTEMFLRDIAIDEPKFIENLHNYKQQSIVRFVEDRKGMKERLFKLLADPKRMVGRLERQGVIRKGIISTKKKY